MKKALIFIFTLCSLTAAHSQNLIEEIKNLTLANDSLQKQVILPLNDSLKKVKGDYEAQLLKLQDQIENLKDENDDLEKKTEGFERSLTELAKNKIKTERDLLLQKVDSLSNLASQQKDSISQKDALLTKAKQNGLTESKQANENGKLEVIQRMMDVYNKPLDSLIEKKPDSFIQRDFAIVDNYVNEKDKFSSIQKYFLAKEALDIKFNEQQVQNALTLLKEIEQTPLVTKLVENLKDYKITNEALIVRIQRIADIDRRFLANNDAAQELKMKDILFELAWFFRNYQFEFSDYPHLSKIILSIMKEKQRNANTDIQKYLDDL